MDLSHLSPTARVAYAKAVAHSLAVGVEPHVAEQIAWEALEKAGLVRVAKSLGKPTRISKRIEPTKAKPAPTEAELGQSFLDVYAARKAADPKARVGEIHSAISREYPALADAYRSALTGR